jgi:hypothetical protein
MKLTGNLKNSQGMFQLVRMKSSPEIFLDYRAHQVMTAHTISAADTLYKAAQNCNVHFKFAPPRTRVTVVRVAAAQYSPVRG